MQSVLIVVELFVSAGLIIVIMLQRSEGGALGMGGSGSGLGGLFSPRGAADTLTRTTGILAILFFLTCLGLNLIALRGHNERSILDTPASTAGQTTPKSATPRATMPTSTSAINRILPFGSDVADTGFSFHANAVGSPVRLNVSVRGS